MRQELRREYVVCTRVNAATWKWLQGEIDERHPSVSGLLRDMIAERKAGQFSRLHGDADKPGEE